MPAESAKRYAPATLRNREPIREVLRDVLPERGKALEIGSGTGEHAVFFAASFPEIVWQPTDADPECLASIAAWMAEAALPNLRPPLHLNVEDRSWTAVADQGFDAVVSINMIHIAPWEACRELMAGAARVLRHGGVLYLYGPFMIDVRHTAPSNAAFDESLKEMDPRFGVRDVAAVAAEAAVIGLTLEKQVPMPANNLSLIFRRQAAARESW
jgi:cyclopropane fatty-acyl-phospholipid synthase-like methyltransferase